MQGATGEAAPRQMAVDDGKTQGNGPGRTKILLHPGHRRRNSSATAARLRMTEKALGWVMIGSVRTRTNREQSLFLIEPWPASAPMGQGPIKSRLGFSAASSEEAAKG
jgi:hypothetical protein